MEPKWRSAQFLAAVLVVLAAFLAVSAERRLRPVGAVAEAVEAEEVGLSDYVLMVVDFLWKPKESSYQHVWPSMKFGWQIVVGTIIGFLGSAFGSVGGVGGGGIYVPMLTLIIGFDAKSSTAISKCMIMGAAGSTVWYNLKLRHPTLDMPIIDYDLALLFQPMLMLGISIGVAFNVIFADWMVTVLLIILFIGTSTKAFLKGVETWKKETIMKREAKMHKESNVGSEEIEYKALPSGPGNTSTEEEKVLRKEVPILENVCWKELGLVCFVWVAFLVLQVVKQNYTTTCSLWYWILNFLQVPVSLVVAGYEAVNLYKGKRAISSRGDEETGFTVLQLVFYCFIGVLAGVVGGLLGLGGGFILGPVFLELGVPPQVSSATATFAMTFSSSMSVVEYYLLKRFPVPYALYLVAVSLVAAFVGQHIVRKIIEILGRASIIIFILSFTIFVSAISLGGVGISNMIYKIEHHEYMGFEDLCTYEV
ncbi:sulfite exporter TauE/SafE family protein 3-like isoform X1 [Zingiber officinale]|uniref:sulfite exporter TauE/SafE family protein 3-like isoform X1 n=1 Tax=Zingiber officinale TaxID=94328 RepID=UPI001C4BEAD3|nr:sulfite exporter TauE/SafE family protein 3-like isoform X1 [Zingiber officinale]